MTNEEVEARLQQMRADAQHEESERSRRLAEDERYYKEEEKKVAPVFLSEVLVVEFTVSKMGQDAFTSGGMSLEQRVSSRRHFSQRE